MGQGMNLAGGMSAGSGADALQDLLKQKFLEQLSMKKLAEEQRQANMANTIQQGQLGQGQQRIGLEGQRLTQEGEQFGQRMGLDTRKQDADESQFAANAPVRLATTRHLDASTADLTGKPAATEAANAFRLKELGAEHTNRMGEIGAQGSNAVRIAGMRPKTAPQVFFDESGKPIALDFSSGQAVEVPLPAGIAGKAAPKVVKTTAEIQAEAAARAQGTAEGKTAGAPDGILDKVGGMFGGGGAANPAATPGMMRARDPQGHLHEAPAGTPLPAGWKLEG